MSFPGSECGPVFEFSGPGTCGSGSRVTRTSAFDCLCQGIRGGAEVVPFRWRGPECGRTVQGAGLTLHSRAVVCRCRCEDNRGVPGHREAPAQVPAPGPPPGSRDGERLQERHLPSPGVPEPQHPGDWPRGGRPGVPSQWLVCLSQASVAALPGALTVRPSARLWGCGGERGRVLSVWGSPPCVGVRPHRMHP